MWVSIWWNVFVVVNKVAFGPYYGNAIPSPPHYSRLTKVIWNISGESSLIFLLSKQVFRTVKYAATLLANMKVCPGTPNSHIMGKCVLTNHRHGILALKTRRTRSVCSFIIICFFWLVGANIKTILFKFVNISPNHSN